MTWVSAGSAFYNHKTINFGQDAKITEVCYIVTQVKD